MDAVEIAPRTPQRAAVRLDQPNAPRRPVRGGGYYVARAHLLLPRTLWADLNLVVANEEDDYDVNLEEEEDDEYHKGRRELKRARDHWVRIK